MQVVHAGCMHLSGTREFHGQIDWIQRKALFSSSLLYLISLLSLPSLYDDPIRCILGMAFWEIESNPYVASKANYPHVCLVFSFCLFLLPPSFFQTPHLICLVCHEDVFFFLLFLSRSHILFFAQIWLLSWHCNRLPCQLRDPFRRITLHMSLNTGFCFSFFANTLRANEGKFLAR